MKIYLLLFSALFYVNTLVAQTLADPVTTVNEMFDAMRTSNGDQLANCFHPEARLHSVGKNKDGKVVVESGEIEKFVKMVSTPHKEIFNEEIYEVESNIDGSLATVWAPYTFYVGDKLSHCGTNAFQLVEMEKGWQVLQITDTRYRKDCPEPDAILIQRLMDNWHHAAAVADEDVFFGSMTPDAIYLGTDDSERWLRDDMAKWAQPYFDKESAWAFTAKDRELYFANDSQTAWFEERLETWMGPCRGSGVLQKTEDGWKLAHYNLAMLVPNDKVDDYLKVIGRERKKK